MDAFNSRGCRSWPGALTALVVALFAVQRPGVAQIPDVSPTPHEAAAESDPSGSELKVYLLTLGPGERIWEVWGHNAIWIRDPQSGLDEAYNWGMFDFAQEGFLGRLAKGTMLYWMAGLPGERMIREYAADNRDVWAQELTLNAAQRADLLGLLRATDTPERRFYRYDYYLDNCSSRIRDVLDGVLGGAIARQLKPIVTGATWRSLARAILRPMPAAYVGMEFALGSPADGAVTAWDEGFLPMLLREHLRGVTVVDDAGREVPLVAAEVHLVEGTRTAPPEDAPFWFPWFLAAGLGLAGVVALAGTGGFARVLGAGWSLVIGVAGILLSLAWLYTDHTFWYRNENLFQVSPLSVLLALLFVGALFRHPASLRWVGPVGTLVAGLAALGFALQALPAFDQVNGEIIAVALPVHLSFAWMARRLGQEGSRAVEP